eukprot:CAMPEP_0176439052 /NCGR_PEP_ID=MMETSP0127-20121128/19692_1 /TAXON_ID=938130 /ORGANISM="Platyophrya macrostoma, Strain WH" /LENGTH=320 /DNA_ID=CAMNT_0017823205 /DNA_START=64 /DNA_END=1026 /DNA_ORIENTATION=-
MNKCRFIEKLFLIIEDPENNDAICWSEAGDSIILKDLGVLATKVLAKYFPGIKYSSFQRQINLYGFKKVTRANAHEREYQQPCFRRGCKNLLPQIKRSVTRDKIKGGDNRSNKQAHIDIKTSNDERDYDEIELIFKIRQARQIIQKLVSENEYLRSQCQNSRTRRLQPNSLQQGPTHQMNLTTRSLARQEQLLPSNDFNEIDLYFEKCGVSLDSNPSNEWPSNQQPTMIRPFQTRDFNEDFNQYLNPETFNHPNNRPFQYQNSLAGESWQANHEPQTTNAVNQVSIEKNPEPISQQELFDLLILEPAEQEPCLESKDYLL